MQRVKWTSAAVQQAKTAKQPKEKKHFYPFRESSFFRVQINQIPGMSNKKKRMTPNVYNPKKEEK
jgi:hypothetical protein